jgi:DNA-binding MurR/RpiR family transcriptional regulator
MSRTPGRRTDDPDDDNTQLEVDEVTFAYVGERLIELGEQLRTVGQYVDSPRIRQLERELQEHGLDEIADELNAENTAALRKTLTGLRSFRREYDRWERIVAEYVMTKRNYTQRDTAQLLGVGVSTINRWAQNPLKVQDYR